MSETDMSTSKPTVTTAIKYEVIVPNSELSSVLKVTNDKDSVAAVANSARVAGTAVISASDLKGFNAPADDGVEATTKNSGVTRSVSGIGQPATPGVLGLVLALVCAMQTVYG